MSNYFEIHRIKVNRNSEHEHWPNMLQMIKWLVDHGWLGITVDISIN